jgi:threonine dehydratase
LEVLEDHMDTLPELWVVPAGGGGLVSGIGCAIQGREPQFGLVAVQSEASPFLHKIFHHGTQIGVIELPSLADGLAGPVEEGSVTIPMVKNLVNDIILVTEDEIKKAIKYAWNVYHECIEGSAAAPLAAVLSGRITARPAVVIITGGNINPLDHAEILNNNSVGSFQVS